MTQKHSLNFDELRLSNIARLPAFGHAENGKDWSIAEWTNAMCGEAGEAANVAKKILRGDDLSFGKAGPALAKEALAKELADTVIYADLCALRLGIDLGEVVRKKFNEVTDRLNSKGIDCSVYL